MDQFGNQMPDQQSAGGRQLNEYGDEIVPDVDTPTDGGGFMGMFSDLKDAISEFTDDMGEF